MFSRKTIGFLKDLKANNNRDWFNDNKQRYDEVIRHPAVAFIEAIEPSLHAVSPFMTASSKKVGGSLMRIHRDIRFSSDKSPYKTNIGIHLRHARARDVHAPGFYLHIEPGDVFFAAGIWQPDASSLQGIRTLIDEHPDEWRTVKKNVCEKGGLELSGSSLKRPPRGFDADHELIDDLKRKDFIAIGKLTQEAVCNKDFGKHFTTLMKTGAPLMNFLCTANDLSF